MQHADALHPCSGFAIRASQTNLRFQQVPGTDGTAEGGSRGHKGGRSLHAVRAEAEPTARGKSQKGLKGGRSLRAARAEAEPRHEGRQSPRHEQRKFSNFHYGCRPEASAYG